MNTFHCKSLAPHSGYVVWEKKEKEKRRKHLRKSKKEEKQYTENQ
jgi:hypothetical protein